MSVGALLQHAERVCANRAETRKRFRIEAALPERAQSPIVEWNGEIAPGRTVAPLND